MPKCIMPPASGPGFVDDHRVAAQRQVPRDRQPARARADDEHAFAGRRCVRRDRPALCERHVAEEPLDGVDAHRLVDVLAVAGVFARVIADAAVHRRHRVVADDDLPRLRDSGRPAPRRATPARSRRPGTRDCRAAGDRRRAAACVRTGGTRSGGAGVWGSAGTDVILPGSGWPAAAARTLGFGVSRRAAEAMAP